MSDVGRSREYIQTVPAELAAKCNGLGIDIGCSVVKIVYRSKEFENGATVEEPDHGKLHVVSFGRSELKEALEYIREHADISRHGDEPTRLYTTGFGCSQFGKDIAETLRIQLVQISEFDSFVRAFHYLASRLSRSQFLEPFIESATVEPFEQMQRQVAFMSAINRPKDGDVPAPDPSTLAEQMQLVIARRPVVAGGAGDLPLIDAEPDCFPCILTLFGSAFFCLKVERDGSFRMVDVCIRGGRTIAGVGMLLSGSKTYGELLELASRGNMHAVDQFSNDIGITPETTAAGDDSPYTQVGDGSNWGMMFSFGKTVGSSLGEFKREDLARSWLNHAALDISEIVLHVCAETGVSRVFLAGGFVSDPYIQQLLTAEMTRRSLLLTVFGNTSNIQFDFIKPGQHLGALGCMLNDIENFVDR